MHAVVLGSLSLGPIKNAQLNKGHWAGRLNQDKPPNCRHLLKFTSHRPGGTVYPSDILHWSFRLIWMHALVCVKWYGKVSPISSLMDWNKASHPGIWKVPYHSEGLLIRVSPAAADLTGQHRWWFRWLNLTHAAMWVAASSWQWQQDVTWKALNSDAKESWQQQNSHNLIMYAKLKYVSN